MRNACITGGSGFLAVQICAELLRRPDWRVTSCVRSAAKAEACRAIFKDGGDRLRFVIVPEMQADGAYVEAVKGQEIIFHTASPFHFTFTDNEKDMLLPAKEGALELLRAAHLEPSVQKVIFTSSFAAIVDPHLDPRPGHTYTEEDWNPTTWAEAVDSTDRHFVYLASKTFAEKAVWDFVATETPTFSVTSVIPPIILGPAAQPFTSMADINQSSRVLWRLVDAPKMPDTPAFVCVDVRDCALAHVLAAEADPQVTRGKRYLTVGAPFSQPRARDQVAKLFPEIESRLVPVSTDPPHYSYSSACVENDLGITWRPFEETVRDTFSQLLRVNSQVL